MNIKFTIRYRTTFGQTLFLCGNHPSLGNMDPDKALPLIYRNQEEWGIEYQISSDEVSELHYFFLMKEEKTGLTIQEWKVRKLTIDHDVETIRLIDTWSQPGLVDYAFDTMAFDTLLQSIDREPIPTIGVHNAIFEIDAPLIPANQVLCILGGHPGLGGWNTQWPILMNQVDRNKWQAKVQLFPLNGSVDYKYGLYDIDQQKFIGYESGNNRNLIVEKLGKGEQLRVGDEAFGRNLEGAWRGTGVAIPIFSIRTEDGMGVGEFLDLKKLADWALTTGMKMIQILPINDTTASNTWVDSYPYAAISVFALHPLYLNVDRLPYADDKPIKANIGRFKKALNASSTVDYERVVKVKWDIVRAIFEKNEEAILKDKGFNAFVKANKDWLPAYAAFCYLRDKNGTPDFSTWETHAVYDTKAIDKLVSTKSKHYTEIAIHYFVQYQLHEQLSEAVDYVHQKGLILKGDIPIGIYRNSVDAWVAPELYFMGMQAGAPPDDFSRKGQNWGFPTYNWNKMAEDDYDWWKKRFSQLSLYFDSFRIDHILGFFRIWQVPMDAVEALLGFFEPAIPIQIEEFVRRGIVFNYDRFCKPFVNESVLKEVFEEQAAAIQATYFEEPLASGQLNFKEAFNTQRKVEEYFKTLENTEANKQLKENLFDLLSNLLFIDVGDANSNQFHPRSLFRFTISFRWLPVDQQNKLMDLYNDYFYNRQEEFWRINGMQKLPAMKAATNMLICGEDLGMVPKSVPAVMKDLGILSLEVQRMPKKLGETFFHPKDAPYLSVVTPSSHDTSTLRGWWKENPNLIQQYYNTILRRYGRAPEECTPEILTEIIRQHLHSPAMWAVFPIQEFLGMSQELRHPDINAERINIPAIIPHFWNYRMHISLEDLLKEEIFNGQIRQYVGMAGR